MVIRWAVEKLMQMRICLGLPSALPVGQFTIKCNPPL